MKELLTSLGVNIASSVIYDLLKSATTQNLTKQQLSESLSSYLNIKDAKIIADKIINFAAEKGDIQITGTAIYATNSISMSSASGTKFTFENNSVSETSRTKIVVGNGASIVGQGGAQIRQEPDGSITFWT